MSVLKLKNSYTRQLEVFEPLMLGRVTMYSCGPTVYSFAHIGNFRSFLFADVLRRVLERNGYEVKHVMNITDVGHMTEDHLADAEGEDKLAKAARELGSDPFKGQFIQFVIPAGVWQAGHMIQNGRYSLFGCTVAPGFTGDIFEGSTRETLLQLYPDRAEDINQLSVSGETSMPEGFAT